MKLIDFVIGALLINAMPHFIFGITKTHFLGLFGFSSKGNIYYALVQFILGIGLFCNQYGFSKFFENGFIIGGLTVMFLYFIFGKFLLNKFQLKNPAHNK
ncbi:hypothetical protein LZQ00_04815 [Sphingobacterium sp. SRCM116780]|uniref:hypothetical protein n=1 Tax=Sphingobacterium sp. SRCM116780 TaxID=2907623 RepID=UPI001F37444C|nr:hypothetical protein [Sphingobacterium sp. SRCM116780]UIR57137.1 hypothetical protein LZQ00_04815 [Sphingobacterium sp. SRCM116780]